MNTQTSSHENLITLRQKNKQTRQRFVHEIYPQLKKKYWWRYLLIRELPQYDNEKGRIYITSYVSGLSTPPDEFMAIVEKIAKGEIV